MSVPDRAMVEPSPSEPPAGGPVLRDPDSQVPGRRDRALGAFYGLALGDALGMPTQSMSRPEILADYGELTGFVAAGPRQRIAAGMPAGSITDDTEQAVLLAELLLEGGGDFDARTFAERLLAWERRMEARGSLDLLGPSTKAAVHHLSAGGAIEDAGKTGTTNGAAMRIAPVGIAFAPGPGLLPAVIQASEVTHNTTLGISGAAAVGAAVSAGVSGADQAEAFEAAFEAASEGERHGHWIAGGSIAARLRWARDYLAGIPEADRAEAVYRVVGTSVSSQESVVAALALAAVSADPWDTLRLAAGAGGDTDTIAAMAGAVLGSVHGIGAWPAAELRTLREVNSLDLDALTDGLLALRTDGARHPAPPGDAPIAHPGTNNYSDTNAHPDTHPHPHPDPAHPEENS